MKIKPLYDSKNYKDFVKKQKLDGLEKKFWKCLPSMWKEELFFRKDFEESINNAVKEGKIVVRALDSSQELEITDK